MKKGFFSLLIPVAVLSTLTFIAAFICNSSFLKFICNLKYILNLDFLNYQVIKDQPDKPPSLAQLKIRDELVERRLNKNLKSKGSFQRFRKSLRNLLSSFNFDLILISYGKTQN